jgi:hypothetical protein
MQMVDSKPTNYEANRMQKRLASLPNSDLKRQPLFLLMKTNLMMG